MNQSQENWPDVQVSLSTATPSLGGALPKLATLKIGYEVVRYNYDYDRLGGHPSSIRPVSASKRSAKTSGFMSLRPRLSLSLSDTREQDEEKLTDSVNVLATETEAGMSSSSFTIPRRATIDSDVSLFFVRSFSSFKHFFLFPRVNHIKLQLVY